MSMKQFFLYLNASGIRYKVCKMLKGKINCWHINFTILNLIFIYTCIENKITSKEFNLSSFETWSLDLSLTAMEKKALQVLLGIFKITVVNIATTEQKKISG